MIAPLHSGTAISGNVWRVAVAGTVLAAGLFCLLVLSAGTGFMDIGPGHVIRIILSPFRNDAMQGITPVMQTIVMDVRLPRILSAALVGGCLGMAGAVFQAILLNPLADPYTLGIASGAAFGASISLLIAVAGLAIPGSTPVFAFAGAVAALGAVLYLSSDDTDFSSSGLILAGVIVSSILSAAIGFMKYLADEQVGVIIFWLMGSFASSSWQGVAMVGAASVAGLAVAIFYSRDLNIMATGHRTAGTLGVNPALTRKVLLVTCSLVTAVCVSVSGIIGFVGLIVPHLLRMATGPDNRSLIPLSFAAGALLLLGADTITRAVLPSEVPIGVLTALIGGPFFCFIFKQHRKSGVKNG